MTQGKHTPPTLVPQLRVLGEPTRLQLLVMLDRRSKTVGELVKLFNLSHGESGAFVYREQAMAREMLFMKRLKPLERYHILA